MITLTCALTCQGPLAIHTGAPDDVTDQPVVRTQRGGPVIPATSLVGALRAASRRRYGDEVTDAIYGHIDGEAVASRIEVDDAHLRDTVAVVPQLRHHVGIDRERLAARDRIRFDEQVWPSGLAFTVLLRATDEDALAHLFGSLEGLEGPQGGLGSGPCPVHVEVLQTTGPPSAGQRLDAAAQRWQTSTTPVPRGEPTTPARTAPPTTPPEVVGIDVHLQVRLLEPMRAAARAGQADVDEADIIPFAVPLYRDGRLHLIPGVPGSSIHGVLRQRAERAIHLAGGQPDDPWDPGSTSGAIARTFGIATIGAEEVGWAGAVTVEDLRLGEPVPTDDGPEGVLDHPAVDLRDRVKIDRLTGAPLGSAKFDAIVVVEDEEGDLRIRIARPHGPVDDVDVALVALGLRDLATGMAGLGGATRSGYGSIAVLGGSVTEATRGPDGLTTETHPIGPDLDWPDAWRTRLRAGAATAGLTPREEAL